ncbi:hypothetical protein N6B72_21975, partial [Chryseobacterium soli]|uniref:hypothetical protein n=1 Tax=Chryseobacterium soli TaxID=445961 RepID=UPI00295339EC
CALKISIKLKKPCAFAIFQQKSLQQYLGWNIAKTQNQSRNALEDAKILSLIKLNTCSFHNDYIAENL